ncbi:hypothetical protein Tco_0816809 [Tanacetum coccineum]
MANSKALEEISHPMSLDFDPEVCNFLADNPAPFRKFPKPFLCFVGISRYYDLDENCYPTFWDDEDEEMDLFAFIYYADLTKVRIGEKEVIEREVPLLELTAGRVVPLACVDAPENQNEVAQDAGADVEGNGGTGDGATVASHTEEGGHVVELGGIDISANDEAQAIVANKPKKLREDHGTVGGVGASTGGKSLVAVQELFEHSTLNVDVGVTAAATVPFVTSFVTPIPEREEGGYTDSVTGPNLPTQPATERFVVLSDSSNHSSTNVASDEVTSVVRSSMPPPPVLTAAIATAVTFGATSALVGELGTGQDNFYVSQEMDSEMLRKTHFPKWDISNESALDESNLSTEFNVGVARQMCLGAEVRMRLEQVLRGKQRLEEIEAADVARAVELESLKEQSVALESATVAKDSEIAKLTRDLSSLQLSYDDFSIRDYSLENEKDKLVDQVSELEATCSGLRGELESNKDASMTDIMDLLCLEGPSAETLEARQLQPSFKQLMVPIHLLEDQMVIGETSLSFALDMAHSRVQRLKGDVMAYRLSFTDAMVPLIEPLSVRSLTGEASTSMVPVKAETIALATTFVQAAIVHPVPSTKFLLRLCLSKRNWIPRWSMLQLCNLVLMLFLCRSLMWPFCSGCSYVITFNHILV